MNGNSAVTQFSVYNFFSVLLPGLFFLFGLYPLLPAPTKVATAGLVLPTLAVSFVVGQMIHILSVFAERRLRLRSHRKELAVNLRTPTTVSEGTSKRFYRICQWEFRGIGLTGNRIADSFDEQLMKTLYVRVRAYVDFDGRGRSQIFQAVYAFCRSVYLSSVLLGFAYFIYLGLVISKGNIWTRSEGALTYTPKIAVFDFPPIFLLTVVLALLLTSYTSFSRAKGEYRRIFVQYLISEFLLMHDGR